MEFYERLSGARMHAALYRPNELSVSYITIGIVKDIIFFCRDLLKRLGQIESKLNATSIWRARLSEVGVVSAEYVLASGATGPLARSAGVRYDVRLNYVETYGCYYYLNIRSFLGERGDCFDRFLIRMREMCESVHIIVQIISSWIYMWRGRGELVNILSSRDFRLSPRYQQSKWSRNMEDLIEHFKGFSEGMVVPRGVEYKSVESAKGEFGILMVSDGSNQPYRCRIRAPAYYHTQLFAPMSQGHYFADLITVVGSQDIVMGEVDR